MQILDIVIYGDGTRVRRLPLRPGALNIITGASKTGKSSLIQIIDYCLGRGECHVPAGVITDNARWYGVRLQFPSKQIFVARKAPDYGRRSSTQVCVRVGSEVVIPSQREINAETTNDGVTPLLDALVGISPNLNIPPETQSRPPLSANIRHGFLFSFQEQSEVANPTMLFHRQGESQMALAIKDTLPYFLGAVHEDRLALLSDLREAKRVLNILERREKEAQNLRGPTTNALEIGLSLLASVQELGLVASGPLPSSFEELRAALLPALDWSPQAPPTPSGSVMGELETERGRLLTELRQLQDQIRAARECAQGQKGFRFEANEQRARLAFVGLYPRGASDNTCPLCESSLNVPVPSADDLNTSLRRISGQLATVSREEPRLLEYIETAERRVTDIRQRLNAIRAQISEIIARQPSTQQQMLLNAQTARAVGAIDLYLRTASADLATHQQDGSLEAARRRVQTLQAELDSTNPEELLPSILSLIGQRIGSYAQSLDLEFSESPLRLDVVNLQVIADTDQGPIPLRRMGSGANWVGYHLATHMALHQWFVHKNRPVPRFLLLDQPTQVYYPQDLDAEGSLDVLDEDDREAVKRMFKWLIRVSEELAPNFQIIVTDHADINEQWFRDHIVIGMDGEPERWRHGRKLIPTDWREGIDND